MCFTYEKKLIYLKKKADVNSIFYDCFYTFVADLIILYGKQY